MPTLTSSKPARETVVAHAAADWVAALGPDWASRAMDEHVTDRLHVKQGRSVGRWAVPDGPTVYLKRHFALPRWHGLLATVFPRSAWSPALEEWEHLSWVAAAGLPVPRAVAVAEYRGPWGRLRSLLAVEEIADGLPLHEAIPIAAERLSAGDFLRWKRGLVEEMARLSRELHRRRRFHKDLYLCHFYVTAADCGRVPADWCGRVTMIDFHRLGRHTVTWWWYQVKDLAQLLYSTFGVPGVTTRDRLRFWKLYRGAAGDWPGVTPPLPRPTRAAVRWKADQYAGHHARKVARRGTA